VSVNGNPSLLHELLLARMAAAGIRNQTAATVMSPPRDPYRMEKYRPEAEWLTEQMEGIPHRPVHVRGLHYAALGTTKPDGTPYTNTIENADWLGDRPAKAMRWLALVPWTDIVDQKNDEPRVELWTPPEPQAQIRFANVEVAAPAELAPEAGLEDFRGSQQHKCVLFAEKSAVTPVVLPLAERYGIDTYLEAGEISDTHVFLMAEIGANDGRPLHVFTLSDADPAGWWMPATIAYKLWAFRDGWFPELEFEVHPIGFLPEQVEAIDAANPADPLPSSPLKAGEKRAGAWERTFGIEQVELDAIATLRPEVLEQIVREGIEPFFDKSLDRRVREARKQWEAEAQEALVAQLGPELIARLREEVEDRLAGLREEVDALNDALWLPTDGIELPPMPEIPAARLNGTPSPLASSEMDFEEFIHTLKARGAYAKGGE
jgi:hypothetical protein